MLNFLYAKWGSRYPEFLNVIYKHHASSLILYAMHGDSNYNYKNEWVNLMYKLYPFDKNCYNEFHDIFFSLVVHLHACKWKMCFSRWSKKCSQHSTRRFLGTQPGNHRGFVTLGTWPVRTSIQRVEVSFIHFFYYLR